MKDIEEVIRTAYFNLLNNISVSGKSIPFFDRKAPYGTQEPYVIWFGMAQVADNTKSSFGNEVSIDLLVYQSESGDWGGSKQVDQISNAITQKLTEYPGHNGISPVGIHVITTVIRNISGEFIKTNTKDTYRKRITIEHLIDQG